MHAQTADMLFSKATAESDPRYDGSATSGFRNAIQDEEQENGPRGEGRTVTS